MRDETNQWLKYADENLQSSKILCENSRRYKEISQKKIRTFIKVFGRTT